MHAAAETMTTPPPPSVRDDIAAFEAMRPELEAAYLGKWVLFFDRQFIAVFDTFDSAAATAVGRFGKGPYLIRRIGAHSVTLPTSVMYGPMHAINLMRV